MVAGFRHEFEPRYELEALHNCDKELRTFCTVKGHRVNTHSNVKITAYLRHRSLHRNNNN
jgi:hypothetical protein